jgi:hypothetical protein
MSRALRACAFGVVSALVFAAWWWVADTERIENDPAERTQAWRNIGRMIDGTAPGPFVRRRLHADGSRVLAAVVPDAAWRSIAAALDRPEGPLRPVRVVLDRAHWPPARYAELISAHLLIWASILGLMYVTAWLAAHYYEMPPAVGTALGVAVAIGLLGGYSASLAWRPYSYDVPQAFIFLLTIYAIAVRRSWWPLAFVAAVYSKETSLLLLAAFAILRRDRIGLRSYWLPLGLMAVTFVVIQLWIRVQWPSPDGDVFWYPARNARLLAKTAVYNSWFLALGLVAVARARVIWPRIPVDLKWLLGIGVVLVVSAFFKGWTDERRALFEGYPIAAIVLAQWVLYEFGRGDLMSPRRMPRLSDF